VRACYVSVSVCVDLVLVLAIDILDMWRYSAEEIRICVYSVGSVSAVSAFELLAQVNIYIHLCVRVSTGRRVRRP